MNYVYSAFIGRFQPFHLGHATIIRKLLDEGKRVAVLVRDTGIDADNPYNFSERKAMIKRSFLKEYRDDDRLIIRSIPDISEVVYGREVGYEIREIKLGKDIENISSTKIRNAKK